MGIMDMFSGKAGRDTAVWQAGQIGQARDQSINSLMDMYGRAYGTLAENFDAARGVLPQGFSDAGGYLKAAMDAAAVNQSGGYAQAVQDLNKGQTAALDAMRSGFGTARSDLQTAQAGFSPYTTAGTRALDVYQGAMGLGTPEQNAAARAAFTASPGYQYQVDQATDAAARKAAALGIAGSGNTLNEITNIGSQLANQDWNNWKAGLTGLYGTGLQAQGQVANLGQSLAELAAKAGASEADLYRGTAKDIASLSSQHGSSLADLASRYGAGMAGLSTGQAGALADLFSGQGRAEAGLYAQEGQNLADILTKSASQISDVGGKGMMAGQQASANQMNALLAGANLLTSFLGGGGGGGSIASGLGNLFSGRSGTGGLY